MTSSDQRTATRGAARTTGPVELPEIVPATSDEPGEPASSSTSTASSTGGGALERDATEHWVDTAPPPVVVATSGAPTGPRRVQGRRPRVRKVTRTIRHLDPWSTFKVSLIFSLVLYGVLLTSGVLIWNVAANTGTVANVERWFMQFGWESFELNGGEIFANAWVAGLFAVVALTGFAVLLATLFNLVSDMVGGVRVTVLEEEVVERTANQSRKYVVRRPPAGSTDPWSPAPASPDRASPGSTSTSPDASSAGASREPADPATNGAWATGGPATGTTGVTTRRTARRVDTHG